MSFGSKNPRNRSVHGVSFVPRNGARVKMRRDLAGGLFEGRTAQSVGRREAPRASEHIIGPKKSDPPVTRSGRRQLASSIRD